MKKSKILLVALGKMSFDEAFALPKHVVRDGDTLSSIAERTGFTPDQLALMNGIEKDASLVAGQEIKYFTIAEVEAAERWCAQRVSQLPRGEENSVFFKNAIKDLRNRNFRFSVREASGLHVSNILYFARAWHGLPAE